MKTIDASERSTVAFDVPDAVSVPASFFFTIRRARWHAAHASEASQPPVSSYLRNLIYEKAIRRVKVGLYALVDPLQANPRVSVRTFPYFAFRSLVRWGCAALWLRPVKRMMAVVCALTLPGCATMFRGDRQPVRFVSDPPGAQVEVATGQPTWCRTPCTIDVKRSQVPAAYAARFSDREPLTAELSPAPEAGIIWLPLAVFDEVLIVPGIVDQASVTFMNYPTDVTITLPPEGRGGVRVAVER